MASERLQVILELITGRYKQEAQQAARATSQIDQSARKATTSTGNLKGRLDSSVSSLKTFAGGAAIGAAVIGLGKLSDFAQGAIDSYSNLNESLNATNVAFGENAEGIQRLGRESATSLGIANSEFNQLAVSMSAFAEAIAGPGGDVVGTMDDLTTRAADFASVMNLEVSDAFEKFRSGLAGESEPLRKFGIDVSAARVEAFALANGISEAGAEMTEGEKIQARYGLIMEQTAGHAGDFANTSGELANQTRITNARLENQRAIVGETLQVYREWGNVLSLEVGQALAQIALGLQEMSGEITTAEGILRRWEIQTGSSVEGMEDLVEAWRQMNDEAEEWSGSGSRAAQRALMLEDSLGEMVRALDLSTDELLDAVDNADSLAHQMDLTAEQTDEFEAALRERLSRSLDQTRENFGRAGGAAREWRDAQSEATSATDSFGSALARAAEQQRALTLATLEALDPAVRASEALGRMRDAQAALDEVQADNEATAQDVAEAQLDYATAVLEAQAALDQFSADDPEASVRALADTLRISNEEARAILEALDLLDGKVVNSVINLRIRTTEISGNQSSTGRTTSIGGRQHGGPVDRSRIYQVGENNQPELLLIPGDNGRVFSNADVRSLIQAFQGGERGQTVFNIPLQSTGNDVVDAQRVGSLAAVLRRMETMV